MLQFWLGFRTPVSRELPTEQGLWGEGDLMKGISDIIRYLTAQAARRKAAFLMPVSQGTSSRDISKLPGEADFADITSPPADLMGRSSLKPDVYHSQMSLK